MNEFELIRRFFQRPEPATGVRVGIGDDGAVLEAASGRDIVTVVDTLVESVHFPANSRPFDIGYRAVAVNLSDIAAMGAVPRWMTLALTMPRAEPDWLSAFADGLFTAASAHDVALVGGDTTSGNQLVVTVQITGDVASGTALRRSGAKAGDTVYVSGTLGDAAAGLALLQQGRDNVYLTTRFLRPDARVKFGQHLVGKASAAMDISDGLYGDLGRMLEASGVGARLNLDTLPLSEALRAEFTREECLQFALAGGDDYELLFTSDEPVMAFAGIAVTAIGDVRNPPGIVCFANGAAVDYTDTGFQHFQ